MFYQKNLGEIKRTLNLQYCFSTFKLSRNNLHSKIFYIYKHWEKINNYFKYPKRQFTFKFSKDKEIPEKLEFKYIKKVNNNIDEIIEKFKIAKSLSAQDNDYFTENCIFYNLNGDRNKLKIILNVLFYLIKLCGNKIELKNNSEKKLIKNYKLILSNNIDLFVTLEDFLDIKNEFEKHNLEATNFNFFLSDIIREFIQTSILIKSDEGKIDFILENYRIIIQLIDLPFFKKTIGDLYTNILQELKNQFENTDNSVETNKEKQFQINEMNTFNKIFTHEFQEIFYLFYLNIEFKIRKYTEDILNKRFKDDICKYSNTNQDLKLKAFDELKIDSNNKYNKTFNTLDIDIKYPFLFLKRIDYLNFFTSNNYKENVHCDKELSRDYMLYIDKYIERIIDHFIQNFNDVFYLMKFFDKFAKILLFRDKSSISDLRQYMNSFFFLNFSVEHYLNELQEKEVIKKREKRGEFLYLIE